MKRRHPVHMSRRQTHPELDRNEFLEALAEVTTLSQALKLVVRPGARPYQYRLGEFLKRQSIPRDALPGEVELWLEVVEQCASSMSREELGVYRAIVKARLACQ